jgi:hypothetical protein
MPDFARLLSNPKHVAVVAVAAVAAIAGVAFAWSQLHSSEAEPEEVAALPPPAPGQPEQPEPTAATPSTPAAALQAGAPAPPPEPPKDTARITFIVSPSVRATVTWGKTRLGVIAPGSPLVITRPRDSGPLDVVVKANGYLPVATRAHTFGDSRVFVKLTPPDQQHTLLGYRAPLDAGVGLDGGLLPETPESFTTPLFQ